MCGDFKTTHICGIRNLCRSEHESGTSEGVSLSKVLRFWAHLGKSRPEARKSTLGWRRLEATNSTGVGLNQIFRPEWA